LGLTTEQGVGVASSSSAFPDAPLPARRMHNYEIEIVANLDGTHIG